MRAESLSAIQNREGRLAAARSLAYGAFVGMFEYPDRDRIQTIRTGALAVRLREALMAVDPSIDDPADWRALSEAGDDDDLPVEFTRLFDVGRGAPPCPLHGGLYFGNRMKTMEEALRFYNYFDLTLSDAPRELPDHLTTQLEFLHFLAFREAQGLEAGADAGPWRRAQRDFLARHPGRWVPELRKRLANERPLPYYRELVERLAAFLEGDASHLRGIASGS